MNSSNQSNSSIPDIFRIFLPLSPPEWVITLTVFPILLILYLTVLFVVFKNKNKPNSDFNNSYYNLLCGNGICDVAMLIYTVYTVIIDTVQARVFGKLIDSIVGYVFYWSVGWYGAQIFPALIATNRLVAILWFQHYDFWFSVRRAKISVLLGLLVSFAIPLPVAVYTGFMYTSVFKVSLVLSIS